MLLAYVRQNGLRRGGHVRVDALLADLLDPVDAVVGDTVHTSLLPRLLVRHCGPGRGQPAA